MTVELNNQLFVPKGKNIFLSFRILEGNATF